MMTYLNSRRKKNVQNHMGGCENDRSSEILKMGVTLMNWIDRERGRIKRKTLSKTYPSNQNGPKGSIHHRAIF